MFILFELNIATSFIDTLWFLLDNFYDVVSGQKLHSLMDLTLVILNKFLLRRLWIVHARQA